MGTLKQYAPWILGIAVLLIFWIVYNQAQSDSVRYGFNEIPIY